MDRARVDAQGELCCWNCGNSTFKARRTLTGRVMQVVLIVPNVIGNGGWVETTKKLQCQRCGEFNNNNGRPVPLPLPPDVAPTTPTNAAASWLHDPSGRHELRYWDGTAWTDHVADADVVSIDPASG